jgi:hypothetical protein
MTASASVSPIQGGANLVPALQAAVDQAFLLAEQQATVVPDVGLALVTDLQTAQQLADLVFLQLGNELAGLPPI